MRVKHAIELYNGKEGYNCAQAIGAAFSKEEINLNDFRIIGSGKAPENTCGALYAGCKLLEEPQSEILKQEFEMQTGTIKCRELKREKKIPCKECVRIAAELLNKMI